MPADLQPKDIDIWYDNPPTGGFDQAFINYPIVFQTLTVPLVDTEAITRKADLLRKEAGYLPFDGTNDSNEAYDPEGWYECSIRLHDWKEPWIANCIECLVCYSEQKDNDTCYYIPLSESEQEMIYQQLKELFQQHGTSLTEQFEKTKPKTTINWTPNRPLQTAPLF